MTDQHNDSAKSIINELNTCIDAGFTKSVDAMFYDIIMYLKNRTSDGYRRCKYNKKWYEFGTMMSPIHIRSTSHHQNNVMLTSVELDKLFAAVTKRLNNEKLIVHEWEYKYITSNNVNYTLFIQFELEVPPVEKQSENQQDTVIDSPSHSPDKHEYDFKCGSC